jgi:hypothetical protein
MQIRTHQLPITGRDAIDLVTNALAEGFTLRKLADPTEDAEDDIDLERAHAVAREDAGLVVLCAELALAGSAAATWVNVDGTGLWMLVQAAGQPTPAAPVVIALDCPPGATDHCDWEDFGEDGDRFAATAEAALLPYLRTVLQAIAE